MRFLSELVRWADERPDATALSAGSVGKIDVLGYGELMRRARVVAAELVRRRPAGPVYLATGRSLNVAPALVGCLWAGVPVALVDAQLGRARLAQILSGAAPALLLGDAAWAGVAARLTERPGDVEWVPLEPLWERSPRQSVVAKAPVAEHHAALVLFTSGSTGVPKGVCISRSDLDQRVATEREWFGLGPADTILGVLPLTFDVGLTQLLGTLHAGAEHVLGRSWLPGDVLDQIESRSVAGLALSPVVWTLLLQHADSSRVFRILDALRYVTLSGGTLAREQLALIQANLRSAELFKTYGQTEAFRIAALSLRAHPRRIDSVGRAYPGVSVRILRESGEPAAVNEVGEVVASGAGVMLGYLDAAIDARFEPHDEHRTGDYGYLDEDGFLHLRGRADDMIKVLDRRIFPSDVAHLARDVLGDPSVEVIAIVEDGYLVAFSTELDSGRSERDTLRVLRRELGSHLVPRRFVRLEQYPTTASGKVSLVELKALGRSLATTPEASP